MEITQLLVLGSVIGFLSSFFGIGGGSIIVPTLYTLYPNLPASIVVPISLGSIFFICLKNTISYGRNKLLPPKEIIGAFLLSCFIGGFLGTKLLYFIDTNLAKKIMGFLLLAMVVKLLVFKSRHQDDQNFSPSFISFSIVGFIGSLISSITGLGGGIIFTPIFLNILRVPLKKVSPYSNLAMVFATFIGVIPHIFQTRKNIYFQSDFLSSFFIGNVNFFFILIITLGALFSSRIGIKANNLAPPKTKKALLALLLLGFSSKLLLF
ncbi:MAG: hypothetical protein CME66_10610 [Halobacteriovoraceae bacterium]|nr:hypothetical protein [Halobacteriovoraceae bacterium]